MTTPSPMEPGGPQPFQSDRLHPSVSPFKIFIDEMGNEIYHTNYDADQINRKTNEEIKYYLLHSSVMLRKDNVLSVGGYKEYLIMAEDKILFVDLGRQGELRIIDDILIQYRYSPHSVSMIPKKVDNQVYRLISSYEKNNLFTKRKSLADIFVIIRLIDIYKSV